MYACTGTFSEHRVQSAFVLNRFNRIRAATSLPSPTHNTVSTSWCITLHLRYGYRFPMNRISQHNQRLAIGFPSHLNSHVLNSARKDDCVSSSLQGEPDVATAHFYLKDCHLLNDSIKQFDKIW